MKNNNLHIELNPIKGILICLVAYFFISLVGLCGKLLSSTVPVSCILLIQNTICLALILPEVIKSGFASLKTQQVSSYAIRIASGLACYATLFYIIRLMPISEALLYQYSASLWIPFIMLIWLGVSMPKKLWWGILIGFAGIGFILKPNSSFFGVASLVGILCGILQGLSMVAIRKLSLTEPLQRMLFYYFLISSLVMAPFAVMNWQPIPRNDIALLFGLAFCTYLSQKLLTISLRYANPATLAPVCYTTILFSGLIGWVFWDEIPETVTLLGMFLVVSGCILTIVMNAKPAVKSDVSFARPPEKEPS